MTTVNESGLYDVILDSRKPQAKAFRRWVTSEVLPTIRKHGVYVTEEVAKEDPAEASPGAAIAAPGFCSRGFQSLVSGALSR